MRNLQYPPTPGLPYFEAIAGAKHLERRTLLLALRDEIEGSYESYSESVDHLELVEPIDLTIQQGEALRHCYNGETGALLLLKADIDQHHRTQNPSEAALCQYCGLSHDATDFDHYLPKEVFSEFSVLPLNLVPCCGRCNILKSSAWLHENGSRRVVSIYFDALPQRQFLHAEIFFADVFQARFRLSDDQTAYNGMEQIIRNHFDCLHLLERFQLASPDQITETMNDIASTVQLEGVAVAAQLLFDRATSLARSKSPNHWRVALFQAMGASNAFLQQCTQV